MQPTVCGHNPEQQNTVKDILGRKIEQVGETYVKHM